MTLTAVLLAGGESRRMGADKAALLFRGEPLWERQIELLRSLRPEKIFVSARTKPSWLPPEIELLLDKAPSRGPLSGLTRALEQMETTHLAALAVDMPFVTSGQMQSLWSLATISHGVLPMIGNSAEPLAAIYPRACAGDFVAALSSDDFSLQPLSRKLVREEKLRIFHVPESERGLYRSVNEAGDLAIDKC